MSRCVRSALRRNHIGRTNGSDRDYEDAWEVFSDEARQADDRALWLKVRDTVKAAVNEAIFFKSSRSSTPRPATASKTQRYPVPYSAYGRPYPYWGPAYSFGFAFGGRGWGFRGVYGWP